MSDQKLDTKRRRTIQMLGAAPLLSVPVLGAAASSQIDDTGLETLNENQIEAMVSKLPTATASTSMAVEIHIINSTDVSENTVLIRNTTDEQLLITCFMPGHIIFDGKHMDLNATMLNSDKSSKPLALSSGQSKAFLFDMMPAENFKQIKYARAEHVWADHASEILSEQTSVITLGAFMANTDAVVYANTKQYLPS